MRWFSDGMFRTAEKLDPLALAGRLLTKIAPAARWLWERIKKLLIRVKLFLDRIRERIYVFLAPVFRRIYPAYQTVHRFIASLWAPTMAVLTRIATRVRIAALPIVRLIRRLFRRPRAMLAAASAFVSKLVAQTRVRMKRVSGR